MRKTAAFLLAMLVAGAAGAQGERRPEPGDPAARVPATEYRSSFDTYRRYAESEPASWREANEEVRRLGGHVGHVGKPGAKTADGQEKKAER
jgi:hypothetical protein